MFIPYLFAASVPILIEPPANLTALDGKDAIIPCTAEGAPAPNISWYFNGEIEFLFNYYVFQQIAILQVDR